MRIGRRVGEGEALDLLSVRGVLRLRHHEGDRFLTLDVVVDRHHRRLRDVRVAFQHALDIGRIDVLAAGDEHVVGAADEIMEAVGVPPEHVAGDVEAVGGERRLERRPVVIAVHDGRAFHLQHALLGIAVRAIHQSNFDLGMRIADRHLRLRQPSRVRPEHHRSGLGGAIRVGDGSLGQRRVNRLHQALAHRRRTHADELDAGEIGTGQQLFLVQHHGDHRRHGGEPRAAVALDRRDIGAGGELRQQHDGGVRRAGELGERQRVHVIERRGDQEAVPVESWREPRLHHPDVALVREHDALRRAGRARGVEEHRGLA